MSIIRIITNSRANFVTDYGDEGPIEDVTALNKAINNGQLIGCTLGHFQGVGERDVLVRFRPEQIVALAVQED